MGRINADGSIDNGESDGKKMNPLKAMIANFSRLELHWKIAIASVVIVCIRRYLNPNPLADGKIPAADLHPSQHWKRIANDDGFVRTMTAHLGAKTFWDGRGKHMTSIQDSDRIKTDMAIMLGAVDFGGPDGHVAERGDWSDVKYVQGTRCSTTRSAITAYFCGAEVAGNQDYALGQEGKRWNWGVQEFANFLSCRHQQGQERAEDHRRSVYRISIGCKDALAGYSHAFSIIAQPDGSFYLLQSFIGHYSLPQWMTTMKDHQARLTLDEILAKLRQVERLMNITGWTEQANMDYYELFGVDKKKEHMRRNKKMDVEIAWQPSHRLQYFLWDEACEYPLPLSDKPPKQRPNDFLSTGTGQLPQPSGAKDVSPPTKRQTNAGDKCVYENLIQQLQLHGVMRRNSKQGLGTLLD